MVVTQGSLRQQGDHQQTEESKQNSRQHPSYCYSSPQYLLSVSQPEHVLAIHYWISMLVIVNDHLVTSTMC